MFSFLIKCSKIGLNSGTGGYLVCPYCSRVGLGLRVTSRVRALVDHRPKLDLCLQLRYS